MGMIHALVPLKDLVQAKTRLAGVLQPSERRALMQAMAEDVLDTLANHSGISAVTLVSDDPSAPLLAQRYGVRWWPEAPQSTGLNTVLRYATERLEQDLSQRSLIDRSQHMLIVHADLPLITGEDIDAVSDRLASGVELLIGADEEGEGTNLLAYTACTAPRFAYGQGSCAKHLAWAQEKQLNTEILQRAGIALDIDSPADLRILLSELSLVPRRKTAQFLLRTPLVSRLKLALEVDVEKAVPVNAVGGKEKRAVGKR